MNMYIWDSYEPREVNDKIKYWVDLWEDIISRFNEKFYGLDLTNPQLFIRDIIDEIGFSQFKNDDYRKYLYELLNRFIKEDPAIRKKLESEFLLIRREFSGQRVFYLLQLCEEIKPLFTEGKYFNEAFSSLKDTLLNPVWQDKDEKEISLLSQHLIVEFLLKGYGLEQIGKLAVSLFDKYYVYENRVTTNFPHNVNYKDFLSGDNFNQASFDEAVVKEIDSLTTKDRIDRFSSYYYSELREGIFIFHIEGMKGDVDFSIGRVNFYSPKIKKYISNPEQSQYQSEYYFRWKDQYFINAAVKVSFRDVMSGKQVALEMVQTALDFLRCFFTPKAKFDIINEHYLVSDLEGNEIGSGMSVSKSVKSWHEALDLDIYDPQKNLPNDILKDVDRMLFTNIESQTDCLRKVNYSLRWYRKAEETENYEDKILNYWIVIENLLNFKAPHIKLISKGKEKENILFLAKALIIPIELRKFILDVGWELYWYLQSLLGAFHGGRSNLELPEPLIEACNLNPSAGDTIDIRKLIDNLDELERTVNRKIIKDKVIYTKRFYRDNVFAREQIYDYVKRIKDDLLLVYRFRNKIVHNAHFDNTVLPFYVDKIRKYSGDLLREIIHKHQAEKIQLIEEILLRNHGKMGVLLNKLERNISVDFINLDL